jgi:PAS domain S-box-containing protein
MYLWMRKKLMSENLFEFGSNPAFERLEKFARRAEKLSPEARELVDELLEAYSAGVGKLQVAAEELNQRYTELVATREEIEVQRSRYRDMFEFAPDGYLVTDPAGIIREVNQAAVNLLGISRPNLIGKPMSLYVTLEERERFHLHLDHLLKNNGDKDAGVEWEMLFKSGQEAEFPAALTVAPIKDPNGELTGLRWLLRDITDSKRVAERERLLKQVREQYRSAQEANRLLQALIETMPVGAVISDADGMFLLTNTAGREILGDRIVGSVNMTERPYAAYYPDGGPFPLDQTPLAIALKEKHPVRDVEVLIRRADGGERNLLASAAPILDEAGELLSGISVFQDITERKHAEEVLRASKAKLSAVIDLLPVGIWIVDATGKVTTKNTAADLIWAGDAPLSSGKEAYVEYVAWDVKTGKQLDANDYPLARTLQTGLSVAPVELRIRRFDGTEGIILMSTVPLRSPDGLLTGAVGINIDITERKQAEEVLRESEEKYAALFEKSAVPAALTKMPEGVFADVNEAFESTFGYTCQEILGKTSVDIGMIYHEERQQTYLEMERDGFVQESEKQFRTRSGETRDCLINVNHVQIHGEDFVITTIQDITERKKSRIALRRNAERLGALREIDQSILTAESEEEIGEVVLDHIPQMLECPCANLSLFDPQAGQFSVLALSAGQASLV